MTEIDGWDYAEYAELDEMEHDALDLQTAIDADDGVRYSTDEVLDVLKRDTEVSE